jgi:abhydrolase domain-containing protein 6
MQTRWKRLSIIALGSLAFVTAAAYGLLDRYKMEVYQGALQLQADAAGLQPRQISVAGFDWVYLENGLKGQKPTLLLIHGFAASKENWLDLSRHLKDDFHLVLVDMPGHGETSFDPAQEYDLDDQVQRLHAFTQAIGISQFHMIGNSMGGGISALYGGTFPGQVASIILLNPAGIFDVKSEFDGYLDQGQNPLIVEDEEDFAFLVSFAMEQQPFIPWPLSAASTIKMRERKAVNDQIFADITGAHDFVFKDVITRISNPTLIVWGKQDRVLAAGNAAEFQRLIPASKVALLDGVGHAPMLEIPLETAALVRDFTGVPSL